MAVKQITVEQIIKDYEIEKLRKENLKRFAEAMKYFISKLDLTDITDFISTYDYKYEKLSDETDMLTVTTNEGFCVEFTLVKFKGESLISARSFVTVYYNRHKMDAIEVAAFRDEDNRYIDALFLLFRPNK